MRRYGSLININHSAMYPPSSGLSFNACIFDKPVTRDWNKD